MIKPTLDHDVPRLLPLAALALLLMALAEPAGFCLNAITGNAGLDLRLDLFFLLLRLQGQEMAILLLELSGVRVLSELIELLPELHLRLCQSRCVCELAENCRVMSK